MIEWLYGRDPAKEDDVLTRRGLRLLHVVSENSDYHKHSSSLE
jgi:hypothetical protein